MLALMSSGAILVQNLYQTGKPSVQATNVLSSSVLANTLNLSWTAGNGTYKIVIAKASGAVDSLPVDDITYTASSVFGSGAQLGSGNYVVFKGTENTCSVSGLAQDSTYHFRVFEFNQISGSERYFTDTATGNPSSVATIHLGADAFRYAAAHYGFEDSIDNSSGEVYFTTGNTSNNLTYVAGKIGKAGSFQGLNSYLNIPDNVYLSYDTVSGNSKEFSWAMWVKPDNFTSNRWLVSKRGTSANAEYQMGLTPTGQAFFYIYSALNLSNSLGIQMTGILNINAWNHLAFVSRGTPLVTGLDIYHNGSLVAVTDVSAGTFVRMGTGPSDVTIGQQAWALTGSSGFSGLMDQVVAFKYALSAQDVTDIYNSGNGVEYYVDHSALVTYESFTFVMAQRAAWKFASDNNKLYWTSDNGVTWRGVAWGVQYVSNQPVYNKYPDRAYIFDDGTVLFGVGALLYRSTDGLQNISLITPKALNGVDPFPIHTPVDPTRPGTYFMAGSSEQLNFAYNTNGVEMLVFHNYGSVAGFNMGAVPTVCWYTIDKGATVKAFYVYGANLLQKDDGSADGGSTGTILGDQANTTIVCRHGHNICHRPGTNEFYSVTGDFAGQVHWLKHVYTPATDSWVTSTLILSANVNSRWYGVGLQFVGTYPNDELYWSTDIPVGGPSPSECGVWKIDPDNLAAQTGETHVLDIGDKLIFCHMVVNGKLVLAGTGGNLDTSFAVVDSLGTGAVTYYPVTDKVASITLCRTCPPDSRGFMKMCFGGAAFNPRLTIYVKP